MEELKMTIFANIFSYGNTKYESNVDKKSSPSITIKLEEGNIVHLHFMGESSIKTLHKAIHELEEKIKERDNKLKGGENGTE